MTALRIAWAWLAWRVDEVRGRLDVALMRFHPNRLLRMRGQALRLMAASHLGMTALRTETPQAFRERVLAAVTKGTRRHAIGS